MTANLFTTDSTLEKIPLDDAEIYYLNYLDLVEPPQIIMNHLISEVPWRAEKIKIWGKTFAQPRLIAWYGDKGKTYKYSSIQLNPLPWTNFLLNIKKIIEGIANTEFNSVLLNYYRNNHDSMGFHSDDEKELGEHPIIASLSLGEERTFVFKHKFIKTFKPVRLKLASGSLLIMREETQQNWKHGIEKETIQCGPRVNLTFRNIKT